MGQTPGRTPDHSPQIATAGPLTGAPRQATHNELLQRLTDALSASNTLLDEISARERALQTTEARWRAAFEDAPAGMVEVDLSGQILQANQAAADLLACPTMQLAGRQLTGFVHPDERLGAAAQLEALGSQAASSVQADRHLITDDGEDRWVTLRARRLPGAGQTPDRVLVHLSDVTAERLHRERLEAARARFSALVEHGSDAIVVAGDDGRLLWASPAFVSVTGSPSAAAPGADLSALMVAEDRQRVWRLLRPLLERFGEVVRFETRVRHRQGGWRHVEVTATNRLHDPSVRGLVMNVRDVTDRVEAAARLAHQAMHDGLTGLPNRTQLVERLGAALSRAVGSGRRCAVLFMDLDGFKDINDTLGHYAGDELLVTIADRLHLAVRPGDVLARLGGDEFVVVAENLSDGPADALALAERIRGRVRQPVPILGRTVSVGCSIGIALSHHHTPEGHQTPEGLLQEADLALYRAKAFGRDRSELYDRDMRTQAELRLETEELVRHALATGGVTVHYQPIVALQSGETVGSEALARIRTDDGRLVTPEQFVPVAEQSGLIIALGTTVLAEACAQGARWRRQGRPRRVSVNVSARQLSSDGFVAQVGDSLARSGLPGEWLCLELSETALIEAGAAAHRHLQAVKELGVALALDDFGTGWSSLASLRRFPVDVLKIDRSFVGGLGASEDDGEVVKAVIGLGTALRLTTVAEGVETETQDRLLRQFGCRYGQGYRYGAPAATGDSRMTPTPAAGRRGTAPPAPRRCGAAPGSRATR